MRLDDFLGCFFNETETVYLRGLNPKGMPKEMQKPTFTKETTREKLKQDKELQQLLKNINTELGLYFVVNSGGFEQTETSKFNAVFCEIDNLPIDDQHDLYELSPLPPSLRVETKKSVHAYWLLSEEITRETWYLLQCGLIQHFKSDAGIKNSNRLMRLPFFNHVSWTGKFEYKRVLIHTLNNDTSFTAKELSEAYPFVPPKQPKPLRRPDFSDNNGSADGLAQELRYRISCHPTYRIESDKVHGTCKGICHNGEGNTAIMVNLQTGAVFCHSGCDYWTIAGAFGIAKPKRNGGYEPPRLRPRQIPQKETGRRLLKYVYGKQNENG